MRTIGLTGVSFGGVSRSDGWSAIGRSSYQMGIECHDGVPAEKQRAGHLVEHVRHWLLLPDDVDPSIWTRKAVWEAAGRIEKRRDAREGRFFDISWPRELPTDNIEGFVDDLYRGFLDMDLAVQIDWETSPAKDGLANDHIHGLISTRTLSKAGFAKSKCRALDAWFRSGVRHRVADLFNAIAQACSVDVHFDPQPNTAREDALPPEDRLPRKSLRNGNFPGRKTSLEQRDLQRGLRREHAEVVAQVKVLEGQACDLQAEIDAALEDMSVLTSWQSEGLGAEPLPLEVSMTAFMSSGIIVDMRIAVDGVGVAFVAGGTVLIDAGERIFMDGEPGDDAVRAMHVLARRKGWRDLSLVDPDAMPVPVPREPARPAPGGPGVAHKHSRLELMGKDSLVRAARQVVQTVRAADADSRRAMLARDAAGGNCRLEHLVAELVGYAGEPADLSVPVIVDMIDRAMDQDNDLWGRYVLERDFESMTVPGTPLSRPFRPPLRFYDLYQVPPDDGARHDHAQAGGDVLQ